MREAFSHKMRIKSEIVVLGHIAILASNACVVESVITPLKKNGEDPTIFYPVLVMNICLGNVIQQLGRWSHREWEIVDRAIDRVCMRGDVKRRTTQSSDFYL